MHLLADRQIATAHRQQAFAARRQQRLAAWILIVAIGSFAALALPLFLGQVYVADDLGAFHLPLRSFYAQQLADGQPFDWMPSLFGGFYLTAEGQLGAYHPLHLLLYRWLPLNVAFDLELLASYPFMFAGTFIFLKQWLKRRDAAMFGALTFTFCGFNLLHFVHPNAVAIVAHIPWLLWATEAAFTQPRGPRRATSELAVGLLTASQLLLGYPQYVWFSLLTVTTYAAWRSVALRVPLTRLGTLSLAVALGALTAAVQWVPTLDALADSTRSTADAAFANTGALHPLNLVQFVAPYLFTTRVVGQNTHELGLYAGAAPLLLCVWLFFQRGRWGRFRPLICAATLFGGLSLLFAFGQAGGLYRIQQLVPVVNHFRFPCRAIVLVQWCIAVGAATAIALLLQHGDDRPADNRRADRALVVVFALSVALAILGPVMWPEYVASGVLIWCGPLLVGSAAVLVALATRRVRPALFALVALTAVDLTCYGLSYSVWPHTAQLQQFIAETPLPPGGPGTRIAAQGTGSLRTGNRMLLAGLMRADGYAGLEPTKRLDRSSKAALQLAGVETVLLPNRAGDGTAPRWQPIAPTAPRARLTSRTVPLEHMANVAALGFDVAAVDEPIELPEAAAGAARVIVDAPGHLTIACSAPDRQLLVTTESYHHGWRATIDGQLRPVVRVNGDFLGCVVDVGSHDVILAFHPNSLRWGKWLSFGGLGLLLSTFALHAPVRVSRRE